MFFDGLIQQGLGDGRVVHLAMPVPAVANEIDDNITSKGVAILQRNTRHAHYRVHILAIDMKNGNGLAFGNVGSKGRRVQLAGRSEERRVGKACSAGGST